MSPIQDPSLALSKPSGFMVGMRVMSVVDSRSATLLTRGLVMVMVMTKRKRQGELMLVFMLSMSLFLCLPCMKQVVGKVDEHFPTHRLVAVHVARVTHLATTSFDILTISSLHFTIGFKSFLSC